MKRLRVAATFAFSVLVVVSSSSGQTPRADRPYQGLFGGDVEQARHVLTVNGSAGGGYDDNVLADASGGNVNPSIREGGHLREFSGNLRYSVNRNRLTVGASAMTWLRDYPDFAIPRVQAHNASVNASMRVRETSVIALSQSAAYQPYTFANFFPSVIAMGAGEIVTPNLDVSLLQDHYMTYAGSAGLDQRVGRRAFWSGDYAYRIRDASARTPQFSSQQVGTNFRFVAGRDVGVRFGYDYQEADYGTEERRIRNHDAGIGLDFAWPHSPSRRTTLSIDTGGSATRYPSAWRHLVNAGARLNHDIGRTWNISLAYRRGMVFVETLQQPLFADSATFQVAGLLSRRI